MDALISVKDLTKSYTETSAIDNVSFEVQKNEFVS